MNYRHSFHAGNHTEVFKHAVLIHLLEVLRTKEKPFFVLDTHGGSGIHDLQSEEAVRTGEAREGIELAIASKGPLLTPYLQAVGAFNRGNFRYYPGSPGLIASMLRPNDRATVCELHAEDYSSLKTFIARYPNVSAQHRNGYEAMLALVPPKERRGLVFVDPPFEEKDEIETAASHLLMSFKKWRTGIFAVWYPIKDRRMSRTLRGAVGEKLLPKSLAVEFLRQPIDEEKLAGSGMVIVNAPWNFDILLTKLCSELKQVFCSCSSTSTVEWICAPT